MKMQGSPENGNIWSLRVKFRTANSTFS